MPIAPFTVDVIAPDPWPPLAPEVGLGLARLLETMLDRAGLEARRQAAEVRGQVWISDRWQAEIGVAGKRHPEEAAFDQGHHLLYRLAQFAAAELGGELSDRLTRAFEDFETRSPGALLACWAALGAAEPATAARHWQRGLELDPAMVAPRAALAKLRLQAGDGLAAAGLMGGVTVKDPAAAAELGIGIWAAAHGDAAAGMGAIAAQLLQSAVAADREDAVAAAALAALMARRGAEGEALDEALLLATQATQLASDDYRAWAALADVHRALGEFTQAGFFYGFALRLQPDAASVLKDAGACWLLARQADQALPLIERALALAPSDPENLGNLAFAHDLRGDHTAALAAAREAARLNPADARMLILHGELALRAGQREEALTAWARATELDPAVLINPAGGNIGLPEPPPAPGVVV